MVVEARYPLQCRQLNGFLGLPRCAAIHEISLVQSVDRLGQPRGAANAEVLAESISRRNTSKMEVLMSVKKGKSNRSLRAKLRSAGSSCARPCLASRCATRVAASASRPCNDNALAVHLLPDLVGTLDLHVGLSDLFDMWDQLSIALGASSEHRWIAKPGGVPPIAGRAICRSLQIGSTANRSRCTSTEALRT